MLYRRMVRSTDCLEHLDIHQVEVEEAWARVLVSGWELDSVTAKAPA